MMMMSGDEGQEEHLGLYEDYDLDFLEDGG